MTVLNEIRDKIRTFLNLFKPKQDNKLDKISNYYQSLSKKPPKINKKIK